MVLNLLLNFVRKTSQLHLMIILMEILLGLLSVIDLKKVRKSLLSLFQNLNQSLKLNLNLKMNQSPNFRMNQSRTDNKRINHPNQRSKGNPKKEKWRKLIPLQYLFLRANTNSFAIS